MEERTALKKGIAVAGNMIVDRLYPIAGLPGPGELTTVEEGISSAAGGAVCNVVTALARLDARVPLTALGRVGCDEEGAFLLESIRRHPNVDVSGVRREGQTSFTAVMVDQSTKQRTFFQYRGANARFCEQDIDFAGLNADIFHIGYILLLDALDAPDKEYGTKMARLLHTAQSHGLRTSIDVVTEAGSRFGQLVPPALKYTDYCIINEMEAQATTGVPLRSDSGDLLPENMPVALGRMKELGVSTWAVIHCPEGGFGLDESGNYFHAPSLRLPKTEIVDTVGAGDAFCSGVLYGAWSGMPLPQALELANGVAGCSLTRSGATDGLRGLDETRVFCKQHR